MKSKIILSLVLAICCVIASIPASAAETATCPPHTSFIKLCGGFAEEESQKITHSYDANGDGYVDNDCTYMIIEFYTAVYCSNCYDEMANSMKTTHTHGIGDHICGESNYNACPLPY